MKKELWISLGVLLFLISALFLFNFTYAKYRKNVGSSASVKLASWDILVNNESILGKDSLSQIIQPIFDENDYVKSGVVAPGSLGYYDIVLDAKNTDVSFQYKITSEIALESDVKDFIITSYEINPSDVSVKVDYSNDTGILGNMLHNSPAITIRIYVQWNDNILNETMDNAEDTKAASKADAKALLNAKITFSQLKS